MDTTIHINVNLQIGQSPDSQFAEICQWADVNKWPSM